jgi:transcriptional regulator with XRE-family HTH domain
MATKTLAKQIEQFRLGREMTIRQVAEELGVSTGTIVRILRGEKCNQLTEAKILRRLGNPLVTA